jgi:hypothetical protein
VGCASGVSRLPRQVAARPAGSRQRSCARFRCYRTTTGDCARRQRPTCEMAFPSGRSRYWRGGADIGAATFKRATRLRRNDHGC